MPGLKGEPETHPNCQSSIGSNAGLGGYLLCRPMLLCTVLVDDDVDPRGPGRMAWTWEPWRVMNRRGDPDPGEQSS